MSDLTTGYNFTDGEKGITAAKENDQVNKAVVNPEFYSAKPLASTVAGADTMLVLKADNTYAKAPFSTVTTSVGGALPLADNTQNGMLRQVSNLTTDYVDGTNNVRDLISAPAITLMRLRSYNALGNSTFEVDQRQAGAISSNPSAGVFVIDRWRIGRTASTMAFNAGQANTDATMVAPGTNFRTSSKYLWAQLTTQQASLAAGDHWDYVQTIEGASLRELISDAFSLSVYASASVATKFGVTIQDVNPSTTKSLSLLCSITAVNTPTLFTFPNLPVLASGGNWNITPGIDGAQIRVCLAAGTTATSPANGSWQNGNFQGATGQDNFASKATSSVFRLLGIQLEPGPNCTQLIDKPFTQNLSECQRYYFKSNPYGEVAGTPTTAVSIYGYAIGAVTYARFPGVFPVRMAKTPTVRWFGNTTTPGQVLNDTTSANVAVSSNSGITDNQWGSVNFAAAIAASSNFRANLDADTGW